MTTTPDFRALCAELLAALETEGYAHWTINPSEDPLVKRARTALATPPPEPPTDKELSDLWVNYDGIVDLRDFVTVARAALERWGQREQLVSQVYKLPSQEAQR